MENMNHYVPFLNRPLDKKKLSALLLWVRFHCGESGALKLVENLKSLGFSTATQFSLSLGIEDLALPKNKTEKVVSGEHSIAFARTQWKQGKRTPIELFQQIIDTWHQISEILKDRVVDQFHGPERMNSVYMMAFSGARGNLSQVRQLVSMRGLMANPQGEIVGFPIISNFREGLTMTEYFVSCYGARKGVIDTALRTADAGYLTRRLVDVAHHVIIRHNNCGTAKFIRLKSEKTGLSLAVRLVGRVSAETIVLPKNKSLSTANLGFRHSGKPNNNSILEAEQNIASHRVGLGKKEELLFTVNETRGIVGSKSASFFSKGSDATSLPENSLQCKAISSYTAGEDQYLIIKKNKEITEQLANLIVGFRKKVKVRSPLTCVSPVCQLCYGYALAEGRRVALGEAVGILAAQSLGEPGTQLTLRTFHTGGVFSGDTGNALYAPDYGSVNFSLALFGDLVRTAQGDIAFLTSTKGVIRLNRLEEHSGLSELPPMKQRNQISPRSDAAPMLEVVKGDAFAYAYAEGTGTGTGTSASQVSKQKHKGEHQEKLDPREFQKQKGDAFTENSKLNKQEEQNSLTNQYFFSANINAGTLLFVRQHQYVLRNQLLANLSSQQIKIRLTAEEHVFANFSGQIVNLNKANADFWVVAGVPQFLPFTDCSSLYKVKHSYFGKTQVLESKRVSQEQSKKADDANFLGLEKGNQERQFLFDVSGATNEKQSNMSSFWLVQKQKDKSLALNNLFQILFYTPDSPVQSKPSFPRANKQGAVHASGSRACFAQESVVKLLQEKTHLEQNKMITWKKHEQHFPLYKGHNFCKTKNHVFIFLLRKTRVWLSHCTVYNHTVEWFHACQKNNQSMDTTLFTVRQAMILPSCLASPRKLASSPSNRVVCCDSTSLPEGQGKRKKEKVNDLSINTSIPLFSSATYSVGAQKNTAIPFAFAFLQPTSITGDYPLVGQHHHETKLALSVERFSPTSTKQKHNKLKFPFHYNVKKQNNQKMSFPLSNLFAEQGKLTCEAKARVCREYALNSPSLGFLSEDPAFLLRADLPLPLPLPLPPAQAQAQAQACYATPAKIERAHGTSQQSGNQESVASHTRDKANSRVGDDLYGLKYAMNSAAKGVKQDTSMDAFLLRTMMLAKQSSKVISNLGDAAAHVKGASSSQVNRAINKTKVTEDLVLDENFPLFSKNLSSRKLATSIACIPLEHQKTIQCESCLLPVGSLVSSGQEICTRTLTSPSVDRESVGRLYAPWKTSLEVNASRSSDTNSLLFLQGSSAIKDDTEPNQQPHKVGVNDLVHQTKTVPLPLSLFHKTTDNPIVLEEYQHELKKYKSVNMDVQPSFFSKDDTLCKKTGSFFYSADLWSPNNPLPYTRKESLGDDVTSLQESNQEHGGSGDSQEFTSSPATEGRVTQKDKTKTITYSDSEKHITPLATPESGQIMKIDKNKITLRRAHCHLITSGSSLSVVNKEFIKKGATLFSLKYEKLLTGDIVQGLGKIEELLESPKLSLNLSFKTCLRRYLTKVSLDKAIQWSYAELQEDLVKSVQQVYIDQGCFISDKHLEIIVRQATSLAVVLFPGDTGFLHHEVVSVDKIEKINKQLVKWGGTNALESPKTKSGARKSLDSPSRVNKASSTIIPKVSSKEVKRLTHDLLGHNKQRVSRATQSHSLISRPLAEGKEFSEQQSAVQGTSLLLNKNYVKQIQSKGFTTGKKAIYYPHLKGITWSSLNSDSILSAASFQETRRVLRDNLVTDKVDFLRGIKERIILGELLEMGTGFLKNNI